MPTRKRFYFAIVLTPEEEREATEAEVTLLIAEVEEQKRAKELMKELGLNVESDTTPCPPPNN